jgi:hypothetical protein
MKKNMAWFITYKCPCCSAEATVGDESVSPSIGVTGTRCYQCGRAMVEVSSKTVPSDKDGGIRYCLAVEHNGKWFRAAIVKSLSAPVETDEQIGKQLARKIVQMIAETEKGR